MGTSKSGVYAGFLKGGGAIFKNFGVFGIHAAKQSGSTVWSFDDMLPQQNITIMANFLVFWRIF